MLPPVDYIVLQDNPQFAVLHDNLSEQSLRLDGSSKSYREAEEATATTTAAHALRRRFAERRILISALQEVDLSASNLTSNEVAPGMTQANLAQLVELVVLLSSILTSPHPPTSESIATLETSEAFQSLPDHLPNIGRLVAAHLRALLIAFCRLNSPHTNPSYLHRQIPSLARDVATLQEAVTTQQSLLNAERVRLTTLTSQLLSAHQGLQTRTISHLEHIKHGRIAQHTRATSALLAARARAVAASTRDTRHAAETMVYTPRVRVALENYVAELRVATERANERAREAKRRLWGYGVGRGTEEEGGAPSEKERRMKELARRYGELLKEVDGVKRDVQKLSGRWCGPW